MVELQHRYSLDSSTGRWTILSTILASGMAFIDSTALNVILPSLQKDLEATGADLFWVLNSYMLMLAALIIVGGSLGDKVGRVRIFMIGILIFTISSAACGFAQTILQLIIFRGVQGIGGALMIPGSLAIISAIFTKEEKGKAIGTWSAATTIVTICGPVLGGALADLGMWRLIFFINVPLGLFALWALYSKVPESKEYGSNSIDWQGAILLFLGLGSVTFGFLEMPEWGYNDPIVISSLIVGAVVLILFFVFELQVKEPMVPLTLFSNRTFAGVNLQSFFLYAGLGSMMLFLSLNIIQVQGYSQLQAGLTFMPFSIVMILLARKMGTLSDKLGPRNFLIIGPALAGVGMFWLSTIGLTTGPKSYWTTFFVPFVIFAVGMAITVVPLTTAVMSSVDESKSGIASGINNSVTRIASTFIIAISGAIAIFIFTEMVTKEIGGLGLGSQEVTEVLVEAAKLGEATAPEILTRNHAVLVDQIYDDSFIKTYQWIGRICAALAFIASLIGFLMIRNSDCIKS